MLLALLAATAPAQQRPVRIELSTKFTAEGGTIHAAAFSPDGTLLATGGETGDLRVIDLASRAVRWLERPSDHWIGVLAFSPDGTRVACLGRHLTIHAATTGKELLRIENVGPHGFAWLPDGERFAYAAGGNLVVRAGEKATTLATIEYPINAIAIADDSEIFIGDNVGRTWRVPTGGGSPELRRDRRTKKNDMVSSLALVFAGGTLFDFASDGSLHCDDPSFRLPSTAHGLTLTPDRRAIVYFEPGERRHGSDAPAANTMRWSVDGGATFEDAVAPDTVTARALRPDGQRLFLAMNTGRALLYERGREPIELPSHVSRVNGLAMTRDGRTLAIRGKSWSLHPLDGRPTRALPSAVGVQTGAKPDELIVQYADRAVVLDTPTGKEVASVPTPHRYRDAAREGPASLLFLEDELLDGSGSSVTKLPEHVLIHNFSTVALASDGRWAVGGVAGIEGDLGGLVITDASGKNPRTVDDCPVWSVAFSPDAKRLYYACGSGISMGMGPPHSHLRIRDTETLELLHQLDVHISQWHFIDANRALVSTNRQLQVWDVDKLEPIQTLPIACGGFLLSDDLHTLVMATAAEVLVYRLSAD